MTTNMEISLNIDDPQPQFKQLIAQIKAAVVAEIVKPGDPLPSIRQLANDLDVNNKTVAKAYKLLERDNVIQTKGYRGTYVHDNATENCHFDLQDWTLTKMKTVIDEFRQAGVTDSEMRNAFSTSMNNKTETKGAKSHD